MNDNGSLYWFDLNEIIGIKRRLYQPDWTALLHINIIPPSRIVSAIYRNIVEEQKRMDALNDGLAGKGNSNNKNFQL